MHLIFVVCCAMAARIWKVALELVARVVQRGQDADTSLFSVKDGLRLRKKCLTTNVWGSIPLNNCRLLPNACSMHRVH